MEEEGESQMNTLICWWFGLPSEKSTGNTMSSGHCSQQWMGKSCYFFSHTWNDLAGDQWVSSFRPSYCQLLCQELFSAHMWRMSERAVPLFARRPSLGSSSSGEKQRNPLGPLGFGRTFKGEEQRLLRWLSAFEWQVWVIPVFRVFTQRSIEERKSYWEADFFWWTWLTAAFTSPTVTMDGHESFPGCLIV